MSTVLVTGGAGYIGSQNVKFLRGKGYGVMVLDDLSGGFADAVPQDALIRGNIGDAALLDRLFSEHRVSAVLNFASFIQVSESVENPSKYFCNNVANTLVLLDAMVRHGISRFVFSSTAAIFGNPEYSPLDEEHPKVPINPYGRSKWLVEQLLEDYATAYGLHSVCLRYFNAAGADPDGELGERHDPETHLVPIVLQAASGRREHVSIYGDDYETPDGTCVRDYIHVEDLAQAHWLALEHLQSGGESVSYNLGNGAGYSVRDVVECSREVTGSQIPVRIEPRRAGDPAILVADSRRAVSELGWRPEYPELRAMIRHAWAWERKKGVHW